MNRKMKKKNQILKYYFSGPKGLINMIQEQSIDEKIS